MRKTCKAENGVVRREVARSEGKKEYPGEKISYGRANKKDYYRQKNVPKIVRGIRA